MKFPKSELWDFASQTYQIPAVESACLNLQNHFAADVNVLLFCCWCGDRQIMLDDEDINKIVEATAPWQDSILKPLRNARKVMKQNIIAMPGELLEQTVDNMSEIEINAERMELLAIEKTIELDKRQADKDKSVVEISTANLSLYMQRLETVAAITEASEELAKLLDAIYQDEEAIQVAMMSLAG